MHRKSVLLAVPCDLKKLPIGGLEAFVLSHVQERLRVEEVAENAGLEVDEMLRLAQRLTELGALVVEEEKSRSKRPSGAHRAARVTTPPSSERAMASIIPAAAIPVQRRRADLRALHIGPREGFVLSQIDGATSVGDLVEITRLSLRELNESLLALEAVGAVELPNRKRRTPTPSPTAGSEAPSSGRKSREPPAQAPASESSEDERDFKSREIPVQAPTPASDRAPKSRNMPAQARPPASDRVPRSREIPAAAPVPASDRVPRSPDVLAQPRPPELSEADRELITQMSARIDLTNHYTVLGVERDSDTRTIKRAYHALAARFHPDRFFGKDLGPQKQPLERIFDRITKAYDTLSRRADREAHDATLGPGPVRRASRTSMPARRSSRKMKAATGRTSSSKLAAARPSRGPNARTSSSKLEAARPSTGRISSSKIEAARVSTGRTSSSKLAAARPSRGPNGRVSSSKIEAARPSRAPKTRNMPDGGAAKAGTPVPVARPPSEKTLAAPRPETRPNGPGSSVVPPKTVTMAPAVAPGSPMPPKGVTLPPTAGVPSANLRVARADALLRMFAGKQHRAARDHLGVFLKAAKEALDRDDTVAAANHYRLAVQCTEDPAVHAAFADVEARARVKIHDTSLPQARAAETAGRWAEAAAKYGRAYETKQEAWVAERAANAMRQDGKELKRAAHLAEQAVLAEPNNAVYRVTLGEIYYDAGLMTRAAGEAGRASALSPRDPRVQALAARIASAKRG